MRLRREPLVVFTNLERNSTGNETKLDRLFMGFGYNPDLAFNGERLDILSFFTWMRLIQQEYSTEWTIYDASSYAIVNRMSPKAIRNLGTSPSASRILDALITEQQRPKRAEVQRICSLREQYLKNLIDVAGINGNYLNAWNVFREAPAYAEALDFSLAYVDELDPALLAKIYPKEVNEANKLYLPLEIAEALYLQSEFGVNGKFGPNSEIWFDRTIMGVMQRKGISYESLWCDSGPRKPGYLSANNVIWTSTRNIERLLSDREYRLFVESYIDPLERGGSLEDRVQTLQREISRGVGE